ncbi:DNA-binding response regulator [Caulobacter radicis]|uniref:LytR/AlgR family response regulator transcription factor n=1 Tax=Caulobacter radicis TaxID=2172650 RepID=UPI000D57BBD0|nr:LytTR family DNA-binding domain-containing protein [Caulobacter radicis]PVM90361.1 DNA-binding response regulator [Caulobacter radicis]
MKLLLADDEPLALVRLRTLLADLPGIEVVGEARDGEEAAALIEALRPDLALLDIRMPRQSGMSLARALSRDPEVEVIFVTAFDHFALQAFEVDAVDYLLKPVEIDRLATALDRARRRRSGDGQAPQPAVDNEEAVAEAFDCIWAPHRDGLVRVPISTIDWIEASRDYVLLHTPTRSHILRATMDSLAGQLGEGAMVRVSRSAFVRRTAVAQINRQGRAGSVVILKDGTAVRVGVTYARAVAAVFRGLGGGLASPGGEAAESRA